MDIDDSTLDYLLITNPRTRSFLSSTGNLQEAEASPWETSYFQLWILYGEYF